MTDTFFFVSTINCVSLFFGICGILWLILLIEERIFVEQDKVWEYPREKKDINDLLKARYNEYIREKAERLAATSFETFKNSLNEWIGMYAADVKDFKHYGKGDPDVYSRTQLTLYINDLNITIMWNVEDILKRTGNHGLVFNQAKLSKFKGDTTEVCLIRWSDDGFAIFPTFGNIVPFRGMARKYLVEQLL